MEIRRATPNDSGQIALVLVESWRYAYKGIMPDEILNNLSVEQRADGWRLHLEDGNEAYVLIECGEVIGVIEVSCFRDALKPYEHYAEIPVIYIFPHKIGQGYGCKLMSFAVKKLEDNGLKNIAVWVLEKNLLAISFYKKMGFIFSGVEKEHPSTGLIEHMYTKNA